MTLCFHDWKRGGNWLGFELRRCAKCEKTQFYYNSAFPWPVWADCPDSGSFYISKNGSGGALMHTKSAVIKSFDKWEDAQAALAALSSDHRG